jgi:LemA protein
MEIIIALAVVGLLVLFFIAQYNRLIRLNISVDESFAQIEVQLKRRSDLIPNLVETVKGYAKHEQGTFDAVVTARAKATTASTVADVAARRTQGATSGHRRADEARQCRAAGRLGGAGGRRWFV